MVQRAFVDAANIHPRSFPNRFESLQDFDIFAVYFRSGRRRFVVAEKAVVPEFSPSLGIRRFLLRLRR